MKIQKLIDNITDTYAHPIKKINQYSKTIPKNTPLHTRIGKLIGLEMMRIGLFLSYLLVVPAIFGLIGRITEKPPNKQLSNRIENQAKSLLTLLHRSAQFGHMEIVKALIEAGVDLNTQTNYGYTPLHLAADNGHKEVVEALIEAGAKVNTQDIKGDTPLHKAALRGNTEIVRALMLERADPDIKNNFELTPLDYASLHSSLEVFTKQQELRLKRNKY